MKKDIEKKILLLETKELSISMDNDDNEIYYDASYILNKYYGGLDSFVEQAVIFMKESDKYKDNIWLQPSTLDQLMDDMDIYQFNSIVPIDKNKTFKYITKKLSIEYDEESDEYFSDVDGLIQYGYLFFETNPNIAYSLNVINHMVSKQWMNEKTEPLADAVYFINTQDQLNEITYAFALGEYLLSTIVEDGAGSYEQHEILVDGFKNIYYLPTQKEMVIGINNLDKDTIGIDKIYEDTY